MPNFAHLPPSSRRVIILGLCLLSFGLIQTSGCKSAKKEAAPAKAEKKSEQKAEQKPQVPLAEQNPNGSWKISDDGVRFEPPIPKTQLPDKVWYCDMGTVHYARLQKGDNTCPLCKMKLTHFNLQDANAPAAKADPTKAHGGGHAGH